MFCYSLKYVIEKCIRPHFQMWQKLFLNTTNHIIKYNFLKMLQKCHKFKYYICSFELNINNCKLKILDYNYK